MKKIKTLTQHKRSRRLSKQERGILQRDTMLQNLLFDDHCGMIIGRREDKPHY